MLKETYKINVLNKTQIIYLCYFIQKNQTFVPNKCKFVIFPTVVPTNDLDLKHYLYVCQSP